MIWPQILGTSGPSARYDDEPWDEHQSGGMWSGRRLGADSGRAADLEILRVTTEHATSDAVSCA